MYRLPEIRKLIERHLLNEVFIGLAISLYNLSYFPITCYIMDGNIFVLEKYLKVGDNFQYPKLNCIVKL